MQSETCTCQHEKETEDQLLLQFQELIPAFSEQRGGLIPALQTAQNLFGYLPETVLKLISSNLKIPYSEVTGVVSFYSYFSTQPRGRHIIRVCLGTACYVRGGKEVLAALRKELGINIGETTEDRMFSLEIGRCFGACGLAPVVMVGEAVHQRVKPTNIRDILNSYAEIEEKI